MKKIISLILSIAVLATFCTFTVSAYERPIDVYVSNRRIQSDVSPRLINETTYVPLRAMADALGAEYVSWNDATKTASVGYNGYEISVTSGEKYITANGRCFYTNQPCLIRDSRIFVPVRAFSAAFCADVRWDASSYSVYVSKSGKKLESGKTYYNSDDLYWLSRIISAESSGESLEGKIAVGNVVQNRCASDEYPGSIYEVIFDKKFGVQFSPVSNGQIYNTPTSDSVLAAEICLEGVYFDKDVLYFMNASIATSMWIRNNRPYAFTIGKHSFYY